MHADLRSVGHVQQFQYRPAVDGLRGVAVLAVVGFHAFPEHVPGGYVGVDVFFVISGFLITSIIVHQLQHGRFQFADFYWRRVRRLFPGLVLVLAATLAVGWFVLLPDEFKQLGKHVTAAAAFVANVALWRESGYFDTASEFKPLLHLWSLGIEEQFYVLWPAILVLLWKRRTLLLAVLSTFVLGSFALSLTLSVWAPITNFYSPFSRFWELGLGCLLALLKHNPTAARFAASMYKRRFLNALCGTFPLVGIVLIAVSIFSLESTVPFPGWSTLMPTVGALLILLAPEHGSFQRRVLGSPVLVWFGLISYALYLWHWPLLSFANILDSGPPPLPIRWAAVLLSVLFAWLTYRYLEVPIRKRRDFKVNWGLATAATVAGVAGIGVYAAGGIVQRFDVEVQALRLGPRLDERCLARLNDDKRINYCLATSARPPAIVFVGDSRAQGVYEGAAPLLAGHSVMLLGRGGCPPVMGVRIRGYDLNEDDCNDVWRKFIGYIERERPKVVVIVGNGSFLITNPKIQLMREDARSKESKEALFEYGLRSLLNELARYSKVIHIGEIPAFATAPSCFLRTVRLPMTQCLPERDRRQVDGAMAPYNRALKRVRATIPQIQFVSATDVLCTATVCSQRSAKGPILYRDAMHLSPAGGRLLAENTRLSELISRNIRTADAR